MILAGNPIAVLSEALSKEDARKALHLNPDVKLLMATGGSQGAEAVNQLMLRLLPEVRNNPGLGMIWATGKRYYQHVMDAIRQQWPDGLDDNRIQVFEYFYQIQTVYQAADLFVGRAGMGTITDCQAFGVPAVMIPSPNVSEDHQTKNASVIQQRGAGVLLPEPAILERAPEVLKLLETRETTQQMAEKMHALFDADAVDRIVRTIVAASGASRRRS